MTDEEKEEEARKKCWGKRLRYYVLLSPLLLFFRLEGRPICCCLDRQSQEHPPIDRELHEREIRFFSFFSKVRFDRKNIFLNFQTHYIPFSV